MADPASVFDSYVAEHRAGESPSEHEALSRVEDTDRDELAAMIDAYLERRPRRAWDPAAFEASGAAPFVYSLARSLEGSAGLWPALLPRLRARARLARRDLVGELADRLGVATRRDKVERYYHQMEQGLLDSRGVSDAVLDALGAILGESREGLRRAGRGLGGEGAPDGAVFARTAGAPSDESHRMREPTAAGEEPDEIDRLFRAG